jgi:hypothetical protein
MEDPKTNDPVKKKRRTANIGGVQAVEGLITQQEVVELLDCAKRFIIDTFDTRSNNVRRWKLLSLQWQLDHEIARAALRSNSIDVSDLPKELLNNREFMLLEVARKPKVWNDLTDAFKGDPSFVKVIPKLPDGLASSIFERLPMLRSDREFWTVAIKPCTYDLPHYDLPRLVQIHAERNIRADRELMVMACARDHGVFSHIDGSLWQDRAFVEGIVTRDEQRNPIIAFVPHEIQCRWPELIAQSIASFRIARRDLSTWRRQVTAIAPELWQNRDVVVAWS